MKTILLKFAGPLQSWGTNSNFENRHTDRYPSKSAVVGIIAASLGYRRDEDEKIKRLNHLDFAVRIDQPGKLLKDFHIAEKLWGKPNTYVTNRYYLQDAVFVVAIGSEDESLIEEIEKALKIPYFQTFLGRRSLAINWDFYIKTTEGDVLDSLRKLQWQAAYWYKKKQKDLYKKKQKSKFNLEIYSDGNLLESPKAITRDLVESFSQSERRHSFRSVGKADVALFMEHDAFEAIGG